MPTATRTRMTHAAIKEIIERRMAEALEAYEANRNRGPIMESGDECEDNNRDGNGTGNGDGGNGNRNPDMNVGGLMPVARECTYQDFFKCQPLIFKGTEGVIGLTRWFEKMETVFHISNLGTDATYAMSWKTLMKLMTKVYCPRNEIQKMETKLWNIAVKGNDLTEPTRLQDAIRIANNLMDQKQKGYAAKNTENKRRPQQAATRNKGKAIVNSPPPTYDQEPKMVAEDDALSKEKEIDKLMALISLLFNKIYKPTNNNLRTSSNTSRANQDNTPRIHRGTGYENQRVVNQGNVRNKQANDAAYHKEKMLLCKKEEAGFQLNAEQADYKDDTDDETEDQELEAHYLYMEQIQKVTPDAVDNSGPMFNAEPLQKVQNDDDNYNMFANDREHPEEPKSIKDTYLDEQGDTNITTDSLDMSNNRGEVDHDEDDDALTREHDLLASLIEKLKCEIDESKDRNKLLESLNKILVDKLKSEIENFKNKNKCLESSNNHFKEANTKLAKTNQLMFKDLKRFQAELNRYHDVNYASKVEIDCVKARGELISYKMSFEKSFNEYTRKINDLNQTILEMNNELFAHQETISIMS
ncbi:hypothetical protein Tco_0610594 [Tanacetum coccineum]